MSISTPPTTLRLDAGTITAAHLALYAAASGDHNTLHLDEATARAAGFERPVVHGMLSMALAGRLFTTTFGPHALRTLETRFTGVAQRGMRIVLSGRLEQTDGEEATYQVEAHDGDGAQVLTGSARLHWRTATTAA